MDFAVGVNLSPNSSHTWIRETDGHLKAFYFTEHARALLQSWETSTALSEMLGLLLWEPGGSEEPYYRELLRPILLFCPEKLESPEDVDQGLLDQQALNHIHTWFWEMYAVICHLQNTCVIL